MKIEFYVFFSRHTPIRFIVKIERNKMSRIHNLNKRNVISLEIFRALQIWQKNRHLWISSAMHDAWRCVSGRGDKTQKVLRRNRYFSCYFWRSVSWLYDHSTVINVAFYGYACASCSATWCEKNAQTIYCASSSRATANFRVLARSHGGYAHVSTYMRDLKERDREST